MPAVNDGQLSLDWTGGGVPAWGSNSAGWQWTSRPGFIDDLHRQHLKGTMSSLWNSLLAQADAEDRAALARAVATELRQQLEGTVSTDAAATAMLSPTEAAIRCSVHVETVRRAIRSGQLPATRIGSRLRIDPSDLNSWGAASERGGAARSVPVRRPPRRRQAGVLSQAMSDLTLAR